jgi:hypothetical protein
VCVFHYELSVCKVSPKEEITWLDLDGWIILKCNEFWRESSESLTLDQDDYPWRAVVNTVMNIQIASKGWQCEQRRGRYSVKVMRSHVTH